MMKGFGQEDVDLDNAPILVGAKEFAGVTLHPQPPKEKLFSSNPASGPHHFNRNYIQTEEAPPEKADESPFFTSSSEKLKDRGILEFFQSFNPPVSSTSTDTCRASKGAPSDAPRNQTSGVHRPVRLRRVRAEESYHGEQKTQRLSELKATPLNNSPGVPGSTDNLTILNRRPEARFTIVLDIDNTMVEAKRTPMENYDFEIDITVDGRAHHFYVAKRPYLDELLEYLRQNEEFEVIIFTAAKEAYGLAVVKALDPENTLTHYFLSENHTVREGGKKVKDLELLGRPISTICIVEDNPDSYEYQKRSSFPISFWQSDMVHDTEFKDLIRVLENAKKTGKLIDELDDFKATKLNNDSFKHVVAKQ